MLSNDLSSYLSSVFPHIPTKELQKSLHRAIIGPSADLAHRLDTSANIFWLKWPLKTAGSRLEVYECFDVAEGGRTVDFSKTAPDSAIRRHTKYLFDVAPGLFVERVESGKKMALRSVCRPRVLVHTDEENLVRKATLLTWVHNAASC